MASTYLNSTLVLREIMRMFHNNLVFSKGVDRQYSDQFAKNGAKPGSPIYVRKPVRHVVNTGAVMAVNDTVEESVAVSCATQKHIDLDFTQADLTMKIDDFSKRYLQTAAAKLASTVDYDGLTLYNTVGNIVGTPGTSPATPLVWLQAKQKLLEMACPDDGDISAVLNPAAQTATVNGYAAIFNPQTDIAKQYRKGQVGMYAGMDFACSQNVNVHTCGSRVATTGTITVNTTSTEGDSTISLTGGTTTTLKTGDVFTIASVYAVNPETGQSTGSLQQFVVTANVTFATTATVAIYPTIRATGARKTVDSLPQSGAAVVGVGTASTAYPQNLVYHRNAFTLATVDLDMPKGVDFASRMTVDGISMRIVRQYDINNDRYRCRVDVYYGWTALRPEWACRVIG